MKYNKKGIIGITLATIMIASIFAAINPVPVAARVITLDGDSASYVGEWDSNTWPTGDFVANDPQNDPDIHGYDLRALYAHYDAANNTMYFRLDVDDLPGDLDGDSSADTDCDIVTGPGDCPGVGPYEQYTLTAISSNGTYSGSTGATLQYKSNTVPLADGNAQYGSNCVEYSLANAVTYIDPLDFCIVVSAGGDYDGPGEDGMSACLYGKEPPEIDFDYTGIGCLEVEFNAWATDNASIVNYTWDFGAGESPRYVSGAGPFPITTDHTFSSAGSKTVKLTACNADECVTVQKTVDVAGEPNAAATYSPMCFEMNGSDITFTGSASGGTPPYTYQWEFSDSLHGSSAVETTRPVDAPLTATFTVTDDLGCNDSVDVSIGPCSGCSLRLYGTFGEGAGDDTVTDPEPDQGGLAPENWPYSDPVGPFYPQHWQAPRKDFITFNPAMMDHNQGYGELSWKYCNGTDIQREKEKVFKRMWYEKEWFKDHDKDGNWDVVLVDGKPGKETMTLDAWMRIPAWERPAIKEWNNDPTINDSNVDIYGPAIVQEFTYMFTDEETMPAMIHNGSRVLIPMASYEADNGIDSFDADGDSVRDYLTVESEETLTQKWGFDVDIDHDGVIEPMDGDGLELSGDETLVLMLPEKTLETSEVLQLFDNKIELTGIFGPDSRSATILVSDNEAGGSVRSQEVTMQEGDIEYFYRGQQDYSPGETFFVRVIAINWDEARVRVQVGRMFGQPYANIGANRYWSQKAFMVDGVFYNVVAIKAQDNCVKFITIRQKLPKLPIKLYGKHLVVWGPTQQLPELPPFNEDHEVLVDVWPGWPDSHPTSQQDKIGPKVARPPLVIDYIYEDIEYRYLGELKEIYYESEINGHEELWHLEWFWTLPWQYTEFRLPKDDEYLVTLSWIAPQAEGYLWNHDPNAPVVNFSQDRFKFWYRDCTGPLYIDNGSIRVYGTFDNGPGDQSIRCENKPYTDPMGPFEPQNSQAPHKDFVTFNPAIMDHNQGYPELSFKFCEGTDVQREKEKVFKRMWYEKEWFKDHSTEAGFGDYSFTVVVDRNGVYDSTMSLGDWNAIPAWVKQEQGLTIREHNNDPTINDSNVDIYGPAINQEFTYMFLDEETMPIMIHSGSRVLIPMASQVPNNGIDSFDADGDGERDYLIVTSEDVLNMDIDQDTSIEPMSTAPGLGPDDTVVLMLPEKTIYIGEELQLFDNKVELTGIFGPDVRTATILVSSNEGGIPANPRSQEVSMNEGDVRFFYRGQADYGPGQTFFVRVIAINWLPDGTGKVRVQVGRMFGETFANIGVNTYWNQKAFMVDGVFYNVVAIRAEDNCIKYITFRQKLPKEEIKLFGTHLLVWEPDTILPEMPPFNEDHEIIVDVQNTWTRPYSQQDKIGPKEPRGPLEITYVDEDIEERFKGHLKEIYNETFIEGEGIEDEYWNEEWFWTKPWQYTSFVLPDDQLYLMTLAWYAPEAETTIWDHDPDGPVYTGTGDRVKFWYDANVDAKDLYVNHVGELPGPLSTAEYYDRATNGGNGDDFIDLQELVNAIMDYLNDNYPFGTSGLFDKGDLLSYIQAYIDQESGL